MASAILASYNELCWGERNVHMRNPPVLNPVPNGSSSVYPSPAASSAVPVDVSDDDDERRPSASAACISGRPYVRIGVAGLSRRDLCDLRKRLTSELSQVRAFLGQIESFEARSVPDKRQHPQTPVPLPSRKRLAAADALATDQAAGAPPSRLTCAMLKRCGQILSKLMRQKNCVWFNQPVDSVAMGLHDYHQIIKIPMDLGTVKRKLSKHQYQSPLDFAADVRLTFNNALLYNPAGHTVHDLARHFLEAFEQHFMPMYDRYVRQHRDVLVEQPVSAVDLPVVVQTSAQDTLPPPPLPQPQQQQQILVSQKIKLPKPKAKDPNKRAMTDSEKERLSTDVEGLPHEKLNLVLQIIQKRNVDYQQNGDEVELDLKNIDNETLWELDRFVGNCKKTMSKIRRQEMYGLPSRSAPPTGELLPALSMDGIGFVSPVMEIRENARGFHPMPELVDKKGKVGDIADEYIDIGDELPAVNFPCVEIEKDAVHQTSSSSSGSSSSSSSSSGSDSGSSSGSDSDKDDAHSRSPSEPFPSSSQDANQSLSRIPFIGQSCE